MLQIHNVSTKLIEHIQNSELVQAAITEAVHRFYMDRVCSKKEQDLIDLKETNASNILSTLWNLKPNWRYIIQKTGKRYNHGNLGPNTNAVAVDGKPKEIITLKFEIEIK